MRYYKGDRPILSISCVDTSRTPVQLVWFYTKESHAVRYAIEGLLDKFPPGQALLAHGKLVTNPVTGGYQLRPVKIDLLHPDEVGMIGIFMFISIFNDNC